eukprot:359335-Chlamydomonas_euryale.AAC.1
MPSQLAAHHPASQLVARHVPATNRTGCPMDDACISTDARGTAPADTHIHTHTHTRTHMHNRPASASQLVAHRTKPPDKLPARHVSTSRGMKKMQPHMAYAHQALGSTRAPSHSHMYIPHLWPSGCSQT